MTKLFLKAEFIGPDEALTGPAWVFRPSDRQAEAAMGPPKFSDGDIIRAEIKRPRHPGHHRKYWAMLKIVHEGTAVQDLYPTTDKLHQAIKGALGYYSEVRLPDGKVFQVVDSIAFESMAQDEFEVFYDKAVDLIVQQVVPNLDREDLAREVESMVSK